jgi:hypothetical protein
MKMSKNKIPREDEKLIDVFADLLSLDLYPDTTEEAEVIIKNTDLDLSEFEKKTTLIFRNILSEFSNDWRNVSENTMTAEAEKISAFKLRSDLTKEKLLERIARIVTKISSSSQGQQMTAGLAYRNFSKQTKEDLAQLLRQLEYAASELDIDTEDE